MTSNHQEQTMNEAIKALAEALAGAALIAAVMALHFI